MGVIRDRGRWIVAFAVVLGLLGVSHASDNPNLITMGETQELSQDNSGDGNLLVAYRVTLDQAATLDTLAFYISAPSGALRLAVYANGPDNLPESLLAETAEFTPVVGWNNHDTTVHVHLQPGAYWLAYLPSSSALTFRSQFASGTARSAAQPYGQLPSVFPHENGAAHTATWSFYAVLDATVLPVDGAPGAPRVSTLKKGDIQLQWNAPTTNTDGSPLTDLAAYRLYWGATSSGCPGAVFKVVPSPRPAPVLGDTIEATVTLDWETQATFQVTAVDQANAESTCSNTATGIANR